MSRHPDDTELSRTQNILLSAVGIVFLVGGTWAATAALTFLESNLR